METKYLPLGSIVKLKGGTKGIMITGYFVKVESLNNKIFDYKGCPYPEGVVSSEGTALFNNDEIDEVIFEGYKTDESIDFINKITSIAEEIKSE